MDEAINIPCLFCGRPRAIDADTCPHCKRGWIDARIAAPSDGPAPTPDEPDVVAPPEADAPDATPPQSAAPAPPPTPGMFPGVPSLVPAPAVDEVVEPPAPRTPAADRDGDPAPDTDPVEVATAGVIAAAASGASAGDSEDPEPSDLDKSPAPESAAGGTDGDPERRDAAVAASVIAAGAVSPDAHDLPGGGITPPPAAGPDDLPAGDEPGDDGAAPDAIAAEEPALSEEPASEEPTPADAPVSEEPVAPGEVAPPEDADTTAEPVSASPDPAEPAPAEDDDAPDEPTVPVATVAKPDMPETGEQSGDVPPIVTAAPLSATVPPVLPEHEDGLAKITEEDRRSNRRQVLLVAGLVVALVIGWFVILNAITNDDSDDSELAVPATTTTTSEATSTTAQDTTTTAAPTTTTTPPTTTTLPVFEAVGDPIPLEEMTLSAVALGPLEFGATDAFGRLVATFDQPTAMATLEGTLGLCEDVSGFAASFGPLDAIFTGSVDDAVFVGYRLDEGQDDHPAADLATLSGAHVGDTVADLEAIYPSFGIAYEDVPDDEDIPVLSFILIRESDGETLLWGPVTSSEPDGIVAGIYSPQACDGGPFASS